MKRFAVEKICGWSFLVAISLSFAPANGQYYESDETAPKLYYGSQSSDDLKQPLNQLPPIVSSKQASKPSTMLQPVKGLHSPPVVSGKSMSVADQRARPFSSDEQRMSAGGVSLYEKNDVHSQVQYTGQTGVQVGQAAFYQGSGTRNVPVFQDSGSGTRSLPPIVSPDAAAFPAQDLSNSLSPGNFPAIPEVEIEAPATVLGSPLPSTQSVPGSPGIGIRSTPGTNDYFSTPAPVPAVSGSTVNADSSGCSSCGPGGCYDLAQVQSQMGCCGSVVSAGYYMFLDGLAWTRAGDEGDVQLSTFGGLNDFGYSGGLRLTLGYRENATRGRELTYLGTGKIGQSGSVRSATNGLTPTFTAGDGFNFGDISGFFNATHHFQRKSSLIQSVEYNRVNWAWDLVKTTFGPRFVYFEDETYFFSTNGVQNGLFTMDSVNNLFGLTSGFELFYDVGYRSSVSLTNKYSGFVNSANVDTNLFNGGIQRLKQDTDSATVASSIEIGVLGHYQLAPKARFRIGWDINLMWGLFTIENNIPRDTFRNGLQTGVPIITPQTGANLNTNNQPVFLTGVAFGFEIFR